MKLRHSSATISPVNYILLWSQLTLMVSKCGWRLPGSVINTTEVQRRGARLKLSQSGADDLLLDLMFVRFYGELL